MTCTIKPITNKALPVYGLHIPEFKCKELVLSNIAGVIRLREAGLDDCKTRKVSTNGMMSLPSSFAEYSGVYELEEEKEWYRLRPVEEQAS